MQGNKIDLREKTKIRPDDVFSPQTISFMQEAIKDASGNEVFFAGTTDENGFLDTVKIYARGNQDEVPAILNIAKPGSVIIHNHPSGELTPSSADLSIASILGQNGVGSYIVNNDLTDCYIIVLPEEKKTIIPINIDSLARLIEPEGDFEKTFHGYEYRQQQVTMLKTVTESLNHNKIAVIEAGTGTGKSIAYLIPIIKWITLNKERCLISTNTINLQEQLIMKDIPALQTILPDKFTACLVKGRQNYVCKRKLDMIIQSIDAHIEPHELDEFNTLAQWACKTTDGSLSDLNFVPDSAVWEKICSDSESCGKAKCANFRDCFVTKARRKANSADILIANHHLFFADIAIKKEAGNSSDIGILPPYQKVVLDEAHHIEDVATSYFGARITETGFLRSLGRLYHVSGKKERGFLIVLRDKMIKQSSTQEIINITHKIQSEFIEGKKTIENSAKNFFHFLKSFLEYYITDDKPEKKWRVPNNKDNLINWDEFVKEPFFSLRNECKDYFKFMKQFLKDLAQFAEFKNIDLINEIVELNAIQSRIERQIYEIELVLMSSQDQISDVRWIELTKRSRAQIYSAPINVCDKINDCVLTRFPTLIMTSATLTTEGNFNFLSNRLGLNKVEPARLITQLILSPFDFKKQAFIGMPNDLPEPESSSFDLKSANFLSEVLKITKGGAFVLFTSFNSLNVSYHETIRLTKGTRFNFLKQGDEPRHTILEKFRKDRSSVLFGTDSFWEGVDVKGKSLECVIITKLPFRVPTDPVVEARVEYIKSKGGNPFIDYIVPMAVVKFRQGFGRLIRTKTDRGCVIILDKRLITKSYGKKFIKSLPDCGFYCDNTINVLSKVSRFFME